MINNQYKTICNLLFPQFDCNDVFAPNERTKLSGDILITREGNLYSYCNGGAAIFCSPTTPRLENLHALRENVFLKIEYTGDLNIQLWAYPYGHSGRLIEEKSFFSSCITTVNFPLSIDSFLEGYFDIHCKMHSECTVFSISVVANEAPVQTSAVKLNVLSNYIFPKQNICCEEDLYFRAKKNTSCYSYIEKNISLAPYDSVEFSTYFNGFSCGKWASNTIIEDIYCNITVQGTCLIEVWHAISECQQYKVYADVHEQSLPETICLCVGKSNFFDSGILYLKVYALSETHIYGGNYATSTPKVDDVRLGIVITTYKREEDVKKAVASLVAALPSALNGLPVEIVVVDNGQTLQAKDVDGATLIPNRNLGGSGGFMRGLIHLEDEKRFTHCLFMDDDAFCEPESVARAHALLSFRRKDNLAVAGAMLLQENMHIQHENGAYFDYTNHPIGCGIDLNIWEKVVQNEQSVEVQGMYGAWWFFAFPIEHIKHYAFPFFVRGDDILFSLSNNFSIMTMNGICSWQEDFENKDKLLTVYLALRSVLIINAYKNIGFTSRISMAYCIFMRSLRSSLAYNYYESQVTIMALEDFMLGPSMWIENIDMLEKMKFLKQFDHKLCHSFVCKKNLERSSLHAFQFRKAGVVQVLILMFTLNGHLIPSSMLKNNKEFLYHDERFWLSAIFGKVNITILNCSNSSLYVLKRSTKCFFKNLYLTFRFSIEFIVKSKLIYSAYLSKFKYLTSREFWQQQF